MKLEIITPERRVLSEAVDAVTVPGLNGELGILPGHTPLISQLRTGVLSYTQGGTTRRLHVSGGFVEVGEEHVSLLADVAERPEEIDAATARLERERAERELSASPSGTELETAQERLERSQIRLQLTAESSPAALR